MKNKGEITTLVALAGTLAAIALVLSNMLGQLQALKNPNGNVAFGSVNTANEYTATSTAQNAVYGATITGSKVVLTGYGSLGSFVITGANTGIINFYDATTTDITKRATSKATTTILLASFPASAAAQTYTLDVWFRDGLYVDVVSGVMATGTITYRR